MEGGGAGRRQGPQGQFAGGDGEGEATSADATRLPSTDLVRSVCNRHDRSGRGRESRRSVK
jgi:hypothetical protein